MKEGLTAYGLQIILGLIALIALWKDWKEYNKRSKKWGKFVRGFLTAATALLIVFSVMDTRSNRAEATRERDDLNGQITRLRDDARLANDGFRHSFAGLYDKFSQLQSKVQNGELLKQNATLLQEIAETKKELLSTEAKLNQPKPKPLASFHTTDLREVPVTTTTIARSGTTVSVPITVYNPSDVTALTGSVAVTPCQECSFASESTGFVKVPGAPDSQRNMDFQRIFPKSAIQFPAFDVTVPLNLNRFPLTIRIVCENCAPSDAQILWVAIR